MLDETIMKIMPSLFIMAIVGLGIFSGVYTFSGIGLLMDNTITAIILAAVIQITIATTVLSFPFVTGFFPRTIVLSVYIVFLLISSATAYVYIYNQQSDSGDASKHDITFISAASSYMSRLNSGYKLILGTKEKEMLEAKRLMDEEVDLGGRSGAGSGKGPIFYEKEDKYEILKISYEQEKSKYNLFLEKVFEVKNIIEKESNSQNYASAVLRINEADNLSSFVDLDSRKGLDRYISSLKSPVEKAIDPILRGEFKSIQLVSSIIWSSLFDLASFVIGFIWINKNRSRKLSLMDRIVDTIRSVYYGVIRIKNIGGEVKTSKVIVHKGKSYEIDTARLHRFGARLVAVSKAATQENNKFQALDPLKLVVSKLRVLDFSSGNSKEVMPIVDGQEGTVGILNEDVANHRVLQAIIAIMHLEKLFIINKTFNAYELNRDNEMALDMVIYILNNPYVMEGAALKDYYPKLIEQRYEYEAIANDDG